jgi:hypothetical protein
VTDEKLLYSLRTAKSASSDLSKFLKAAHIRQHVEILVAGKPPANTRDAPSMGGVRLRTHISD